MNFDKHALLLYAVTDRAWLAGRRLAEVVEHALRGGVTMVQLREKDLPPDEFLAEAREICALCRRFGVPFLVNDDVDIALAADADGVHIGQHDAPAAAVRGRIGGKILGVSAQTPQEALRAARDGADYLGVGAVFPTATKGDAEAVSLDTLRTIAAAVPIPVCAIGGIGAQNLQSLAGTGIAGVALVSAIFAAENIEKECERLAALTAGMVKS